MKRLVTLFIFIFSFNVFASAEICNDISTEKFLTFANTFPVTDDITTKELARMKTEIQTKMGPVCMDSEQKPREVLLAFDKACLEALPTKDSQLLKFCKENSQMVLAFIAGLETDPKCDKIEAIDNSGRDFIKEVDSPKRLKDAPPALTLPK